MELINDYIQLNMKTKYLINGITILIIIIMSAGFVSCGDDEDDKKENEVSLIGTWRHDFSSGYILLIIKSNGTGLMEEYDSASGGIEYTETISYYYDKDKERYMIVERDGEYTYTYPIQYFNETTLVLVNPDGKSETYIRVAK